MSFLHIFLFPLRLDGTTPGPGGNFILLEDGFFLLQEDGFRFVLEQ